MTLSSVVKHRLRNIGKELLCLIAVQPGDCFGKDDIVRFGDDYKSYLISAEQ